MRENSDPNASFAETARLAELIEAKRRVLDLLRTLARAQEGVVEAGDLGRLLKMLASKQTLLNELTRIQKLLEPFRDQDPDSRVWRSSDDRERCRAASEQCAALLEDIVQSEKRTESELVRRRDVAAERIANLNSSAEAAHAYSDLGAVPPLSVDVSS